LIEIKAQAWFSGGVLITLTCDQRRNRTERLLKRHRIPRSTFRGDRDTPRFIEAGRSITSSKYRKTESRIFCKSRSPSTRYV
jgi:hypothetical protein